MQVPTLLQADLLHLNEHLRARPRPKAFAYEREELLDKADKSYLRFTDGAPRRNRKAFLSEEARKWNQHMSNPPSAIDLSELERMSLGYEQQQAARRLERQQEYARLCQCEEAAWKLLEGVTCLSQQAEEAQWSNVTLDPTPFAVPLVEGFFGVCDVMREHQLGAELNKLDEDPMIAQYGQDKPPPMARLGYHTAITAMAEGIAHGRTPSLERRLTKTLETIAGRHLWYMMYPIVRGLLVGDYRLFRKSEAPTDRAADTPKRRACYERDHLWLRWSGEGLKPAAIRDRWNREHKQHGGAKIGPGRSGRDVVKEGLRKARAEFRQNQ